MATLNFNATEVEPTTDFDPIPAGKYLAMITESQTKPTKDKSGEYLELVLQILEGEYKNRLVWTRLCLNHSNPTTAKIARGHLSSICRAVGVLTPRDSAELHNLPLLINVKLKKRNDTDELGNEVRGFSKRETTPVAPAQAKPTTAPWKR